MAKQESVDFIELFGSSTIAESLDADAPVIHQKPFPKLPLDDPLYDFEPAGNGGDALARQASDADLFEKIVGPIEDEAQKGLTPVRCAAFTAGREIYDMAKQISARVAKRQAAVAARAPERRRKISAIVEQARRAAPERIRDSEGWDRLVDSCERYVAAAITDFA